LQKTLGTGEEGEKCSSQRASNREILIKEETGMGWKRLVCPDSS